MDLKEEMSQYFSAEMLKFFKEKDLSVEQSEFLIDLKKKDIEKDKKLKSFVPLFIEEKSPYLSIILYEFMLYWYRMTECRGNNYS